MESTIRFLKYFGHAKYTLATLKHKNDQVIATSFPCKPDNLEKAYQVLESKNRDHEIYFMVNEGNGVLNEKRTACHSTANVTGITALFLDAELSDNSDPLPNIDKFCYENFSEPSIIIQTSPNRYHCYWLLEATDLNRQNIVRWKQIQALIHSKLSSDRTMTDLPQILRIPGFKNLKKGCLVEILRESPIQYKLDTLYDQLKRAFPDITAFKAFEALKPLTDNYTVPPGERHEEILRRARKLYTIPGYADQDVACYVDGFISRHVTNPTEFLPNGKRRDEIDRILQAAKTYAENERQEQIQNTLTKIATKKAASPFELDPDFFYQAPGIVGEITRHIVDSSDYPIPSHAFAAATSLVGFTKARYIQGPRALPPLNYFLCLAPSGAGKTTIQHILKECMVKLQIRQLLEDGIASAQGVLQFLANSNGLGIILYDEVKELFQTLKSKQSYETRITSELTKLYTAYASDYTVPTTKTDKGKKIVLNKPLFSFIGYGHHTILEQLISKDNVIEGLIPRFIILNVNERKRSNSIPRPFPTHIIDELRHYVTKSALAIEEKITSSPDSPPVDTSVKTENIRLSLDAQKIYDKLDQDADQLYNKATHERNGLEALFSRGCEQSIRLALAIESAPHITAATMEFSTTLMRSQMQEFYHKFNKTLNATQFAKDQDRLLEKVAELMTESNGPIPKRLLQQTTAHWYKANEFKTALQSLIDQELIIEYLTTLPSGQKSPMIRLGEVI
jgi:hypothetical protein